MKITLKLTQAELEWLRDLAHLEASFDPESRHIEGRDQERETVLTKLDDAGE